MKRKIFLLLFFIVVVSFCKADERGVDSLKILLLNAKEDTIKINLLYAISNEYLNVNPPQALQFATEGKNLAEKIQDKKGLAIGLNNIGLAYNNQEKYLEALGYWLQSLSVFQSLNDPLNTSRMLNNLGAIYLKEGEDTRALEYYLQSEKIGEQINNTPEIITALINIGVIYSKKSATYDKAIDYDSRTLSMVERTEDKNAIGTLSLSLGKIYFEKDDDETALFYFQKSLKAFEGSENLSASLNWIGKVYTRKKQYDLAVKYLKESFEVAAKSNSKLDMTQSLIELAKTYQQNNNTRLSLETYQQAEKTANETNSIIELKNIYEGLTLSYSKLKDFGNAFNYQEMLVGIKDTLYKIDTDKKLGTLTFNFEMEKKEGKINLLTKDQELKEKEISRQKLVRNGFVGGFAIVLLFAGIFFKQRNRISKEKQRSDELLLNILPEETAEELKATGTAKTKSFDQVSVLFTDFKNFTQASELLTAEELVQEINYCYSEFDRIVTKYGIEKIKTIGDAYMCAGGLPVTNSTHPFDVVKAGLEMQQFIAKNKKEREAKGQPFFELRLGIHTGPVVAGIVGIKKFAYDIWGDTVNTASRMESSGEVGKVNISGAIYELVKDKFNCVHRGKVVAKNKGEIDMYFVERSLDES